MSWTSLTKLSLHNLNFTTTVTCIATTQQEEADAVITERYDRDKTDRWNSVQIPVLVSAFSRTTCAPDRLSFSCSTPLTHKQRLVTETVYTSNHSLTKCSTITEHSYSSLNQKSTRCECLNALWIQFSMLICRLSMPVGSLWSPKPQSLLRTSLLWQCHSTDMAD